MRRFDHWTSLISWHSRPQEVGGPCERSRSRLGWRRGVRRWALSPEGLEGRVLLSGNPTLFTVDSIGNGNSGTGTSGTLPYVITQANANLNPAGSLIEFDPTVFALPRTITLANTLELSETAGPEMIKSPAANLVTVNGNNTVVVFRVDRGVTASLDGLTISGGSGDGISNDGTLTVANSTIAHNSSAGFGGGISNDGTLALANSTIADNSASYGGGGIVNFGTLAVANSTIAENSASNGGGIENTGTLTAANCTIADNRVTIPTGLSGNRGGGLHGIGTVTLNNTIIARNTSIAEATSAQMPDDISLYGGTTVSASSANNLIGTGGSGGLVNGTNGNQVGVTDPLLGPLADNGGPTQTLALLPGSPAIDGGSNALALDPATGQPLTTDQRGPGFPRAVHGTVDVGAFEFHGTFLVVAAQPPASLTAGTYFGLGVTAEDGSGNVDTSFTGTVSVALANNPGGATLAGMTSVTAIHGVATFSDLMLDKAGSAYTLRVTADSSASATTATIDVAPAAATRLVVISQPPVGVAVLAPFGLTVAGEDQFGNVDPGFNGSVTVRLALPDVLGGTLTLTAQDGVATFSDLTLNRPGDDYRLRLSTSGLTSTTTQGIEVWTPGFATTYMVNLAGASGAGSGKAGDLVYVVTQANANLNPAGSLIEFDPTVFALPRTITLANTLELSETAGPEMIAGPGAQLLTVSGNQAVQVFRVDSGVTAAIFDLNLANGIAFSGGAIENSGALTVTDCVLSGNSSTGGSNHGNYFASLGGAISNSGTLTVNNSTFSGNAAIGDFLRLKSTSGRGGAIENSGALTVFDCTLSGNSAQGAAGFFFYSGHRYSNDGRGGAIDNTGSLSVSNSTFSGNTASGGGPDLPAPGIGGAIASSGTLAVAACTFAGNSAIDGSGSSGSGGGIAVFGQGNVQATSLDCIFENTRGGNVASLTGGSFLSMGHNLFSDLPGFRIDPTDLVNTDPLLGPLADNGGATMTMALLPGSPAIDAGTSVAGLTMDQRSVVRPQGSAPDIGAFESRGFTLTIASGDHQATAPLSPFPAPLVVVVASPFGEPVAGGRVTFLAPTTGASANFDSTPVIIDASGRAVVHARANGLVGTYMVSAGVSGAHGVAFELANVPPPILVGLKSSVNPDHPSNLVLTFSEPMDAARAQDPANYRLVWAGKDHQLGTGDDRVVPIRSVRYDAASWSVKLRLMHRQPLHRTLWLTMNATSPRGLTNAAGIPLAGAGTGGPGGDHALGLNLKALQRPMRMGLLPDGGFETPMALSRGGARTLTAGHRALAPWRITTGSVNVQTYWPAAEGTQTLDLNGVSAGTIEQTFATIPGQTYQLLFDYANNPDRPARTATATVTVTGVGTLLSRVIAHASSMPRHLKYARFLATFVADTATTTLRFTSTTPGAYGIILDAVSVMAVPGTVATTGQ